eukprot:CAMPEP_0119496686 /NCGR_PEP_ID=MMETSP1344-20130328/19954_1 /TAXON_ID=236787 /ORGANISM="Florenciella parvula, Strain CCMP2471" /LENGTH=117 /DNA_ID=CAMNT_0007532405 /DNA_START=260 /DNA_END=610 /DNA_ORIENTATION=-
MGTQSRNVPARLRPGVVIATCWPIAGCALTLERRPIDRRGCCSNSLTLLDWRLPSSTTSIVRESLPASGGSSAALPLSLLSSEPAKSPSRPPASVEVEPTPPPSGRRDAPIATTTST